MSTTEEENDNMLEEEEVPPHVVDMDAIMESKKLYDTLTSYVTIMISKASSKKERDDFSMKAPALVYGEIQYESLCVQLDKIKNVYGLPNEGACGHEGIMQTRGGTFYDLGSGSGKPVIAAAVYHPFSTCCGVEILEGLYSISLDILSTYDSKGKEKLAREKETVCEFVHGDLLDMEVKNWASNGDVVFCNSTCFDDVLMTKMCDAALMMRKGTFFITVTKRLPSASDFKVVECLTQQMTWGFASIYLHQKITDPHAPLAVEDEDEEQA